MVDDYLISQRHNVDEKYPYAVYNTSTVVQIWIKWNRVSIDLYEVSHCPEDKCDHKEYELAENRFFLLI